YTTLFRSEAPNGLDDSLGLLEVGKVSGALDELETGSWNGRAIGGPVILGADEPVVGTPEEQRGHGDAVQPLGQLRIVEVRLPRVQRGGLAIARDDGQLVVRLLRVVDDEAPWIAILQTHDLVRMQREDVGDVARLPVADPAAERPHQHEAGEPL